MDARRLADLLTIREVDNRNTTDVMRWREAQAEALIEALRRRLSGGK